MQAVLSRWGNSLGVRIPKDIASDLRLAEGARVEIKAEAGRIVISAVQPKYDLKTMMAGTTPQAMREAFDWGPDLGREIID